MFKRTHPKTNDNLLCGPSKIFQSTYHNYHQYCIDEDENKKNDLGYKYHALRGKLVVEPHGCAKRNSYTQEAAVEAEDHTVFCIDSIGLSVSTCIVKSARNITNESRESCR